MGRTQAASASMMDSQDAKNTIITAVSLWREEHDFLIVGLEGYSGAGKTTLLESVASECDFIMPLYMDDFVATANKKEVLIANIENNPNELSLQWAPKDGLEKLRNTILGYKKNPGSYKVLVVEGVFLSHPHVLKSLLDKVIYLEVDKKEADDRRVIREKERWKEEYFPETHPDSFTRLFKIAYTKYEELYEPAKSADLVVGFQTEPLNTLA